MSTVTSVPVVKLGDVDPMSRYARWHRMPLCRARGMCTRVAGHDESRDHPSALHVAAGAQDVAMVVWRS